MDDWQDISVGNWDIDEKIDTAVANDINKASEKRTRSRTAHKELTLKYLYKRAHSEIQLLNCLDDEKLKRGRAYSFITSGDVDALSFLMLAMRTYKTLDYLLVSTWVMDSQDILMLFDLHKQGKIKKMDFYLGEIFKSSYSSTFFQLKELVDKTKCGRIATFRNHSKIFAGITEKGEGFSIQMSANINTNPRTENGCIITDTESYEFFKDYFDGINSFE